LDTVLTYACLMTYPPQKTKESVARDKLIERWDSMAEARVDPGGMLAVIGQSLGPA
jgi:hypothetical protein